MANSYAYARSNYFRVKDLTAFAAWVASIPQLHLYPQTKWDPERREQIPDGDRVCIAVEHCDYGGFPDDRFNQASQEYDSFDLASELAEHLPVGEVAILREVGHEKLAFLWGWTRAITCEGEVAHVSLDDIYSKVAELMGVPADSISRTEG